MHSLWFVAIVQMENAITNVTDSISVLWQMSMVGDVYLDAFKMCD